MNLFKRLIVFYFIVFSFVSKAQFNYGHQMDFGKNRIQYQNFIWTYLDYDMYRVYSYQGGAEIAKYVSVSVSNQLPIIEKRLDFKVEDKLNILVYNNQNDFKQSNIGLSSDEQTNVGGVTKIIGDKISVYFNGSHAELDQQIRAALAELIINQTLYGGSAREMLRNSTLLNLPAWYMQGLVKYISEGWTSYSDNLKYDAVKNQHFNKLNKLTVKQATNVGYALWYYIVDTYGESVIPNILYMTRVSRSPDNAFLYVLGVSLENLIYDFNESENRKLFTHKDTLRKSPINNNSVLKKYKSSRHYYQLKISPDGKQVIYARNELNQMRVYLKTIGEKSQKRLLKYGPKVEQIDDYNYPLLSFNPKGNIVAMIYERKDQLIIHTVDLETKEVVKRNLPGFEKINSFAFSPDGKKLALSAVKKGKGQSDVFVFGLNTSAIEQLTNDVWDDNNPVFVKGNKQIVFESNRQSDTIKAKDDAQFFYKFNRNMDLFMAQYPFTSKVLVRVTNTNDANETQPQAYTTNYISYLSDKNGIYNRYVAEFDSSISFVDTTEHYRYFFKSKAVTNLDRNIIEQNINFLNTHVADVIYANGKDMLLVTPLQKINEVNITEPNPTWFKGSVRPVLSDPTNYKEIKPAETIQPEKNEPSKNKGIDFDNYTLNGEKNNSATTATASINTIGNKDSASKNLNSTLFKFPFQKNYYTSFYTDYVVTQFDNSFLANNYQIFSGDGSPVYLNPGFNFLTKLAISDLFEDQRIVGGFRINPSLDNEFMLSWEQRKKLIDHQILIDRQTFAKVPVIDLSSNFFAKVNTSTVRYSVKYPFSTVDAIRLSLLYRNDRYTYLSNGDFTLPRKADYQNLGGIRLEYIFDNTRKVMLNIFNGFRGKVWGEYWQIAYKPFKDAQGKFMNHNLITFGFDARHYQKVHRQITWCNRIAGGNSLGTERLIFYLGGVDNWINPSFNTDINIVKPDQYGFQTLATNMRGFKQNIRNGNNFLVYNSELRIPIVRYFVSTPFRSDFLNNLQVIGFTDLGMAWYGANPLSSLNTQNVNTFVKEGTGVTVTVINPKNPLVGGMGFGFRSRLFGYFVRLDLGWGIDNLEISKDRVVGVSLATDF
jgi:Tol biopolymer transport system component